MKDNILKWLENSGYPLEMKVASILSNFEIPFAQSAYYIDPETNKMREIDFEIRLTDSTGYCQMFGIIECKHIDKPWIIFKSENPYPGDFFTFCMYGSNSKRALIQKSIDNKILNWEWFRPKNNKIGYGIAAAFTDKKDKTYDARMSCINAAIYEKKKLDEGGDSLSFIFPIIIIDGDLFEAHLDVNNNINIQPLDFGMVYSPFIIGDVQASCVHIVTLNYFEKYLNDFKIQSDTIIELFKDEIATWLESVMKR